jgi:hypothetical protein
VRRAADDIAVGAAVAERITPERCEALNASMRTMRVVDAPSEVRAVLRDLYDADENELLLDIVLADDRSRLRSAG